MYLGRQAIGDDLISGVIKNAGGGTGVLHLAPQPGDGWAPGTAAFDERLVLLRPGLIVIKPRLRHVVTCQFRDRSDVHTQRCSTLAFHTQAISGE